MKINVAECSGIELSILRAYRTKKKRGWDMLYIAVDLHDTITCNTYKRNELAKKIFFPQALETLRYLSSCKEITLILYTSSFPDYLESYYREMEKAGVHFKYLNSNPDCLSTDTGDFSNKFYFNIMLDDKAGLNPLKDWKKIYDLIYSIKMDEIELFCSEGSVEDYLDFKLPL